tara:strand:- start:122 stop:418 length:297 start_codon:yes stop_codon:yes gene_type:complete
MKTYCIDIDGTICTNTYGDYKNAEPYFERIEEINKLHRDGNKIILFTARGTSSGKDRKEITKRQLVDWGLSYDELLFGKPEADVFIDDKAQDVFSWFS